VVFETRVEVEGASHRKTKVFYECADRSEKVARGQALGAAGRRSSRRFYTHQRGRGTAAGLVGRGDGALFEVLQNVACRNGAEAGDGGIRALPKEQRAATARLAARTGTGGAAVFPEKHGELAHAPPYAQGRVELGFRVKTRGAKTWILREENTRSWGA